MSGTSVISPHISFSEELPGRFNDGSGLWEPCQEHMFLGRSCHSFYNLSVDVLELHFHVFFWLRQVIKASADSKERGIRLQLLIGGTLCRYKQGRDWWYHLWLFSIACPLATIHIFPYVQNYIRSLPRSPKPPYISAVDPISGSCHLIRYRYSCLGTTPWVSFLLKTLS